VGSDPTQTGDRLNNNDDCEQITTCVDDNNNNICDDLEGDDDISKTVTQSGNLLSYIVTGYVPIGHESIIFHDSLTGDAFYIP